MALPTTVCKDIIVCEYLPTKFMPHLTRAINKIIESLLGLPERRREAHKIFVMPKGVENIQLLFKSYDETIQF